jgi:hypothetical protein
LGRRISRRVWTVAIVLGLLLIFAVGIVWWGLAASNKPQYQQQISMPSQAGVQIYFVNLWLDPSAPEVGDNQLTAQVTSTIGTPTQIDRMIFTLTAPDGTTKAPVNGTLANGNGHPSESFLAPVSFDAPGTWKIAVETDSGNLIRMSTFTITINGA